MSDLNPTNYFDDIHRLLRGVQATDRKGRALEIGAATEAIVERFLDAARRGGKVLLVGNGGSAALVSHTQNDLCKAVGVRAMVFTEQPLLTAISNDDGYDLVFARPVSLWAEKGDLLIAVSSSGKSPSIVKAVEAAQAKGCSVVTLSGFKADNPLRTMGDWNLFIASDKYGPVEMSHHVLTHYLTDRAVQARTAKAPLPQS